MSCDAQKAADRMQGVINNEMQVYSFGLVISSWHAFAMEMWRQLRGAGHQHSFMMQRVREMLDQTFETLFALLKNTSRKQSPGRCNVCRVQNLGQNESANLDQFELSAATSAS